MIEKHLGSGGFGTVYLARHRFLDAMNVIKRLHDQYASDVEFARKFLNEGHPAGGSWEPPPRVDTPQSSLPHP